MAANAAAPFSVCVHVGKEFEWVAQAYGVHRQYKCWVFRWASYSPRAPGAADYERNLVQSRLTHSFFGRAILVFLVCVAGRALVQAWYPKGYPTYARAWVLSCVCRCSVFLRNPSHTGVLPDLTPPSTVCRAS